jgi:environmental stress-induced protein Ves
LSRVFTLDALPSEPWRNGGGVTTAIAAGVWTPAGDAFSPAVASNTSVISTNSPAFTVPTASQQWDWRVSVAQIGTSGAFSRFPGTARTAVLLGPTKVVLRSDAGQGDVAAPDAAPRVFDTAGAVRHFDGAAPWWGVVEPGAVARLFNVMSRPATTLHRVEVVTADAWYDLPSRGCTVLLVDAGEPARGVFHLSAAGVRLSLGPGQGSVLSGPTGALRIEAGQADGARLVIARFTPVDCPA